VVFTISSHGWYDIVLPTLHPITIKALLNPTKSPLNHCNFTKFHLLTVSAFPSDPSAALSPRAAASPAPFASPGQPEVWGTSEP
jgi:hypothetical protein